jgi:hypothetical protein
MAITIRQSEHGADFPGETFLALKEEKIKKGSQKVTPIKFNESVLEEAILEYFASFEWYVLFGPDIASGELALRDALLPRLMSGEVMVKDER